MRSRGSRPASALILVEMLAMVVLVVRHYLLRALHRLLRMHWLHLSICLVGLNFDLDTLCNAQVALCGKLRTWVLPPFAHPTIARTGCG